MLIEILMSLIFLVALAALLTLCYQVYVVNPKNNLNQYKEMSPGFSDLLNYSAVVDDGIIACKNGSLMAAWLYKGTDISSSTDNERAHISARINQALSSLGNGWMIHVDSVRRAAPTYSNRSESYFPDPVSKAIDDERRKFFENLGTMYESYFIITFTWFPPLIAQRKFIEMMFDDDNRDPNSADTKQQTLNLLSRFKKEISNLENKLSSAISISRLAGHPVKQEDGSSVTHDDFLAWLQFCISGKNHPVMLPSNPIYLDIILGSQEFYGGVIPKIGKNFIQVVAIEGFPFECSPGVLSVLSELPIEYRWSSRFIFMDDHEAVKHLEKYRKKWRQKIRGFFDQVFNTNVGHVDQDAMNMVADAETAIGEINSGLVSMGYYTSVVVLMSEDRASLEQSARYVEKAINGLGFAARIETINTIEAYLGSLPGHGVENVRRPLINTLNLADMIPSNTIWAGENKSPCPYYPPNSPPLMYTVTNGSTPFILNLHVRDLGSTLICGPTRAGKTTLLAVLALQFLRYPNTSIFCFDKAETLYPVTKAVGGTHYSIADDHHSVSFCPLQYLSTKADRAWAMEWIDTVLGLNGLNTTPEQRNEIGHAIMSMHQSGGRTLSEFTLTIQDEEIRSALKQYTVDGLLGHLLDAEEDSLSLSDFTTFEIEHLLNLGEKYALPVLLYLFRRIESRLEGQPAIIILDEAWLMLGHPVFREKIRDWLKSYAKKNCAIIMATHSPKDAISSGIFDVIIESTATKIFLPNPNAREEEMSSIYRRAGLNEKQISIIADAIPKRQYYSVSEQGRRLFELALGPLAMAIAGTTDKDSIAMIKSLEQKHGSAWISKWLDFRGVSIDHKYLEHKPGVSA